LHFYRLADGVIYDNANNAVSNEFGGGFLFLLMSTGSQMSLPRIFGPAEFNFSRTSPRTIRSIENPPADLAIRHEVRDEFVERPLLSARGTLLKHFLIFNALFCLL